MTSKRSFGAYEKSVGEARRFVSGLTGDLPDDLRDAVALMVSELATNALIHASSGFDVAVDRSASLMRVSVSDRGDGTPEVHSPDFTEPHGRGLQIVEALSNEWGIIPYFAAGKTVWFQISLESVGSDGADHGTTEATPHYRPDGAEPRPTREASSAAVPEYGNSDRPTVNSSRRPCRQGRRRSAAAACGRARPTVSHGPVATAVPTMDDQMPSQEKRLAGSRCNQMQRRELGGRRSKSGQGTF